MPMKVGTANVVRLYKQEYVNRPGLSVGITVTENPEGKACTLNSVVKYNGNYYRCEQVEVTVMKDASNNIMHRRTRLTFNPNGGSGTSSSQTRTWGVESVTQPSNPTRSGYNFLGWATTSSASSPNVTFPFVAPQSNTTYYAVWEGIPQTVAPTLDSIIGRKPLYAISVRARNVDSSGSATILMDAEVSPPTTNRGLIAYNSYTDYLSVTQQGQPRTVYATAQVSGELKSTVASIYVGDRW